MSPAYLDRVRELFGPAATVEKLLLDYGANTATIWFTVPVVVQAVKKEEKCPKKR